MPQAASLDTWIRTPSGHPREWDLCPCYKNSELPPHKAGAWLCHGSHLQPCPTSTPPDCAATSHLAWDNARLPTCGHRWRQGLHSQTLALEASVHVSFPSLCVTCLWLYRLTGEVSPNEPGNVHSLFLCIMKALMVIQINSWTKPMVIVFF